MGFGADEQLSDTCSTMRRVASERAHPWLVENNRTALVRPKT